MKTKKLLMCAFAALMFASCAQDNGHEIGNGGGGPIDPNGEAWISLSLNGKTKTMHNPNQDQGTAAESDIKSAKFIFFDNVDKSIATVTKVLDFTAGTDPELGNSGAAGSAFKIPATSRTVLAVINPSAEFNARSITEGTTFSAVNAYIIATNNVESVANTTTGFMMTNASGDLEPTIYDGGAGAWVVTALTLHSTESAASGTPLSINVDRVASKVRVYVSTAGGNVVTDNTDVTITDPSWLLNAKNTKFFPMSERTMTQNELTPYGGGPVDWAPNDQYQWGSYRIDPNYDGSAQSPQARTEYLYLDAPATWNLTTNSEYCLENTQDVSTQVEAYTTHVVVRAKYLPNAYALPGNTTTADQDTDPGFEDSWIMISGNTFTYSTLMEWIELELRTKYINAAGNAVNPVDIADTYSTPLSDALNGYLTALAITPVTLPSVFATISDLATYKGQFTAKKTEIAAAGDKKALEAGTFRFYLGGYNYYPIMIKHDDVDNSANPEATPEFTNGLGEFGVVRNAVYDVNVSKINNAGYPTIPDPSEWEPDEDLDMWLSVQININPWTWYTQTEPL